jgi:sulfur relay (sulfurtransferase) DsrC/TusE family protein
MKTHQTKADLDVLKFIKKYFKEYGCAPTHVAIANEFGLTRQWATYRIDRLKKLGKLLPAKRFGLYVIHFEDPR